MTLTLTIDTERWREHHRGVLGQYPGLVPVCKGNGYGFGHHRLMRETTRLGTGLAAVGTVQEAARAQDFYPGDLLVLTPYRNGEASPALSDRTIRVVSSPGHCDGLAGHRVVVELRSSMRRHGITEADLPALRPVMSGWEFEGFSIHLPLNRVGGAGGAEEVASWVRRLREERMPLRQVFVSHLSAEEMAGLHAEFPGTRFRLRTGTKLWLGAPKATRYTSRVLDVTRPERGRGLGAGRRRPASGPHLVVVSGGVSHGVGLRAPRTLSGLRDRARHLVGIGHACLDHHLSPFVWDGVRCRFAAPPRLQESVLLVRGGGPPPKVGDEVAAQLRYTITRPDRVVEEPQVPPAGSAVTGGPAPEPW
ncbi:alanine racemase [Streptomyces flavovirens]|uniref:alanine racemase n=1 Tax=Streptomyces TaxID=1883 RepID=UPI000DAD1FE9|nr:MULTISPECIES: alanine racemase [unclassified Streptomyces]MYU31567.1 alanine racemase [Streptomyces sp. SID8358]MYX71572.1 alanine racemase [Streptomyces sp. SID3915]